MNPPDATKTMPSSLPPKVAQKDPALPSGSEQIVVIRRHPFGIVALFFQLVIGLGISLGLIFFLLPGVVTSIDSSQTANVTNVVLVAAVIAIALSAIFLLIAASLYRQNRWIISDDSITQVLRVGLFRFQTSGLSMANIEDVTSEKNGIFATIFNFGTLKAETAGEQSNFHFYYCPDPDKYARILLETREHFIESEPEKAERANEKLNTPRATR